MISPHASNQEVGSQRQTPPGVAGQNASEFRDCGERNNGVAAVLSTCTGHVNPPARRATIVGHFMVIEADDGPGGGVHQFAGQNVGPVWQATIARQRAKAKHQTRAGQAFRSPLRLPGSGNGERHVDRSKRGNIWCPRANDEAVQKAAERESRKRAYPEPTHARQNEVI